MGLNIPEAGSPPDPNPQINVNIAQTVDEQGNTYVASQNCWSPGRLTIQIRMFDFMGNPKWNKPLRWSPPPGDDEMINLQLMKGPRGTVYCATQNFADTNHRTVSSHLFAFDQRGVVTAQGDFDGYDFDSPLHCYSLAGVDRAGNCYVTEYFGTTTVVTKFDSQLNELWRYTTTDVAGQGESTATVAFDSNGNPFVCAPTADGKSTRVIRLDSHGIPSPIWPALQGANKAGVRVLAGTSPCFAVGRDGQVSVSTTSGGASVFTAISLAGVVSTPLTVALPGRAVEIAGPSSNPQIGYFHQSGQIADDGSIAVVCTNGVARLESDGYIDWTWNWPSFTTTDLHYYGTVAINPASGDVLVSKVVNVNRPDHETWLWKIGSERRGTGLTENWNYELTSGSGIGGGYITPQVALSVDPGGNIFCTSTEYVGANLFNVRTRLIAEEKPSPSQTGAATGLFRDNGSQSIWSTSSDQFTKTINLFDFSPSALDFSKGGRTPLPILGTFGGSAALKASMKAGVDASVTAKGGAMRLNYPVTVKFTAPPRDHGQMVPGGWIDFESKIDIAPSARMTTDAFNASASLSAYFEPDVDAAASAMAFSKSIFDTTFINWHPGRFAATLFNTADYTTSNDFSLLDGLVDLHVQLPKINTTATALVSGNGATLTSGGKDVLLNTTLNVTKTVGKILEKTGPTGEAINLALSGNYDFPLFDKSLVGSVGWDLLTLKAGIGLDLNQAFSLTAGSVMVTLIGTDGNAIPVRMSDGGEVTSYPAGAKVRIKIPDGQHNLSFTPTLTLPNATFKNETGIGIGPLVSFAPVHLSAGLSFYDVSLFGFDYTPYESVYRPILATVPVYTNTFGVRLNNSVKTAPINIVAAYEVPVPELVATSVPSVPCYLFDQTSYNNYRSYVTSKFARQMAGFTSFLIFGKNFVSSPEPNPSVPYIHMHGHEEKIASYTVLNERTMLVSVPNYYFMLPGVARLFIYNGPALSNSLDLPVLLPVPNPATIGPSFWASDPGFDQVLVNVPDNHDELGNDTFFHRRDYNTLFTSLWTNARNYSVGLPSLPANRFFPSFRFNTLPPLPTVIWNGVPLIAYGDPEPTGEFYSLLPNSAIAKAQPVSATLIAPGPDGGTSAPLRTTVSAPLPAISYLSPASIPPGSGFFQLKVVGPKNVEEAGANSIRSNFNVDSVVRWNGQSVPTSFVSSSCLIATIQPSLVATSGKANITVYSPANGTSYYVVGKGTLPSGGTSKPQTFSISDDAPVIATISRHPYRNTLRAEIASNCRWHTGAGYGGHDHEKPHLCDAGTPSGEEGDTSGYRHRPWSP